MSNIHTNNHRLILINDRKVPRLDNLIDTTELEIDLQCNVGNVLVTTPIFSKLLGHATDRVDTVCLVSKRFDTLVERDASLR